MSGQFEFSLPVQMSLISGRVNVLSCADRVMHLAKRGE